MTPIGDRWVGLVLLAAGSSTRMGQLKQLLPWRGGTLLRHAAKTALATKCTPVIVVLGANASQVRQELDGLPVRILENEEWQSGIGSSLRAGVRAALDEVPGLEGVLVTLADQPLVTAESLGRLLEAFRRKRPPIVAAAYDDTRGVPVVLGRAVLDDVLTLDCTAGAKWIIERHGKDVAAVELPEAAFDIDTPEEYARAQDAWASLVPSGGVRTGHPRGPRRSQPW